MAGSEHYDSYLLLTQELIQVVQVEPNRASGDPDPVVSDFPASGQAIDGTVGDAEILGSLLHGQQSPVIAIIGIV